MKKSKSVFLRRSLSLIISSFFCFGMLSTALAADLDAVFTADMWEQGDGYTGDMTKTQAILYDATGMITGSCIANNSVFAEDGWLDFECTISGDTDFTGIELVSLSSKELTETFYTTELSPGDFMLTSVIGNKQGYFTIDLGGQGPAF